MRKTWNPRSMRKPSTTSVRTRPPTVPARMIVYFASCEDPGEYTGRLFWAEREMAELGVPADVKETERVADERLVVTTKV